MWAAQKHELRHMRAQGSGAIVNCSSLGGLVGLPERAAYHASKHGVIGLTKSGAVEYAPRGIRINVVCPGVIGRAEEVAAAAVWLCSPAACFVVGAVLPVDGGYTTH